MIRKKAFTLMEVTITLIILATLLAIVIPALNNITPNKNNVLFRKAYSNFSEAVHAMLNDSELYPTTTWQALGTEATNKKSICENIASKLNLIGEVSCNTNYGMLKPNGTPEGTLVNPDLNSLANGDTSSKPSFTTADGMDWYFTSATVKSLSNIVLDSQGNWISGNEGQMIITVDVNGPLPPNTLAEKENDCTGDRYRFKLFSTGRIYLYNNEFRYYCSVKALEEGTRFLK